MMSTVDGERTPDSGPVVAKPRFLDDVRRSLRVRHYSRHTERAYVHWIRRFILFHHKRHPRDMGAPEVNGFLTWLAVERKVAASTQNQALAALLYLYDKVLEQPLGIVEGIVRERRPRRLPVVLTRSEVRDVLVQLEGNNRLVATLGAGAPRPQGRQDDDDLHARSQPWRKGGAEPSRWVVVWCAI